MPRKKDAVDGHEGPVLPVDFYPFDMDDRAALQERVAPLGVSGEQFAALIKEMNAACREWAYLRRREVEPTPNKMSRWYKSLEQKAADLADLLQDPEGKEDPAPVSEPQQYLPAMLPYDEDYVDTMRALDGGLEHLPEDPTAEADGSLPWHLDRLRHSFDTHYYGDPPKPRVFQFGNEAMLEIAPLLRALAGAAEDEAAEAQRSQSEEVTGKTVTPTADEQLVRQLAPIYEGLFGRELGRSQEEVLDHQGNLTGQVRKSGPAIRFFQLVFDRLQRSGTPSANTLGVWIGHILRDRKHEN